MLAFNPNSFNNDRQIVLQVDMDSFFASVEVREHSEPIELAKLQERIEKAFKWFLRREIRELRR